MKKETLNLGSGILAGDGRPKEVPLGRWARRSFGEGNRSNFLRRVWFLANIYSRHWLVHERGNLQRRRGGIGGGGRRIDGIGGRGVESGAFGKGFWKRWAVESRLSLGGGKWVGGGGEVLHRVADDVFLMDFLEVVAFFIIHLCLLIYDFATVFQELGDEGRKIDNHKDCEVVTIIGPTKWWPNSFNKPSTLLNLIWQLLKWADLVQPFAPFHILYSSLQIFIYLL